MKNLYILFAIMAIFVLSACSTTHSDNEVNYRYSNEDDCGETLLKKTPTPAPMRQVQYQAVQPMQNCGGCQAREYTVRRPIKVVYQNTTYRTVYEPRTYQTTTYETRPYVRAEACTDDNCVVRTQSSQPVVQEQISMDNEIIEK